MQETLISLKRRALTGTRWLAAVVIAIPVACGTRSVSISRLAPEAVILAFGDSLTFGKGASEDGDYPAVLARISGFRVVNAGVSGERTAQGLERLPQELKAHQPELVILCHGGNDMLQKVDRAETRANLDAMIAMIKQRGADVVLVGVPEPGIFLNPAPLYEQLAREHELPIDQQTVSQILGDGALKSDHIHPNDRGYRRLAEALASLIESSQAA